MAEDRRMQIGGPTVLAFGGLACARAWLALVYVVPAAPQLSHPWFDAGYVALGIAVLAAMRYFDGLARRGWPYAVVLVTMVAAALCSGLCSLWAMPAPVRAVVAAASGVGFGLACLLNGASFVRLGLLRIVIYLAANQVVSSVMVFVLEGLDPLRMTVALAVLSGTAVWCLRSSFEVPCALEGGHVVLPLRSYPWRLYALVALFSLAYGMRQAQMVAGAGRHSGLSTGLLMAAILVWAVYASRRFSIARVAQLSFPLVAAGLLLVLLPSAWGAVVSAYCVSLSYSLVTFAVSIVLYDISQRTGASIVVLQGINLLNQVFVLAGDGIAGVVSSSSVLMVATCVVVVLSLVLLGAGRGPLGLWGANVASEGGLPNEETSADLLARRCHEVAVAFSLTEREESVLAELMGPHPGRVIADELGITQGTLKTHVRHIYEKVGVHTREDLVGLVGAHRE